MRIAKIIHFIGQGLGSWLGGGGGMGSAAGMGI